MKAIEPKKTLPRVEEKALPSVIHFCFFGGYNKLFPFTKHKLKLYKYILYYINFPICQWLKQNYTIWRIFFQIGRATPGLCDLVFPVRLCISYVWFATKAVYFQGYVVVSFSLTALRLLSKLFLRVLDFDFTVFC